MLNKESQPLIQAAYLALPDFPPVDPLFLLLQVVGERVCGLRPLLKSTGALAESPLDTAATNWMSPEQTQFWQGRLDAWLAAQQESPGFDLAIQGTPFQMAVWEELQQIPVGSLVSYSELANRVGRPTAVRAVASACAANPVALFIPCHRVLRKDASLGGYRWGLALKRYLLQLEGAL